MREPKPGDKATIWNHTVGGELIEEGVAELIEKSGPLGLWTVKFDDGMEVLRQVDPNDLK